MWTLFANKPIPYSKRLEQTYAFKATCPLLLSDVFIFTSSPLYLLSDSLCHSTASSDEHTYIYSALCSSGTVLIDGRVTFSIPVGPSPKNTSSMGWVVAQLLIPSSLHVTTSGLIAIVLQTKVTP